MSSDEVIVIDIGTGYTKAGFAGNFDPTVVIPSQITQPSKSHQNVSNSFDITIGENDKAFEWETDKVNILTGGNIKNFEVYEKFMNCLYYQKLRANPEDAYLLLTEAPMTSPDSRENLAEIMFETFNVPGMYIGIEAVMSLFASRISKNVSSELTGLVIDSGAGSTHIVPIVKGYVLTSCIINSPLAGNEVDYFIVNKLKERKEKIPIAAMKEIAKDIKENCSYLCPDIKKEYEKMSSGTEYTYKYMNKENKIKLGAETFLAGEIFFQPELFKKNYTRPLHEMVDECVRKAPITERKGLMNNIILSGGSTMFKGFDKRLQRDYNNLIMEKYKAKDKLAQVIKHPKQRHAVWFGASIFGKVAEFKKNAYSRAQYEEEGPRIARYNLVFKK